METPLGPDVALLMTVQQQQTKEGCVGRCHQKHALCQPRPSTNSPRALTGGHGQTGWARGRDWPKVSVEQEGVTLLPVAACPLLTDAHHADVGPHHLAALQHDLLQLRRVAGRVSSSRAQERGRGAGMGAVEEGPPCPPGPAAPTPFSWYKQWFIICIQFMGS